MKFVDGKLVRGPRLKGVSDVYHLHSHFWVRTIINLEEGWSRKFGNYQEGPDCIAFGIKYHGIGLSNFSPPSVEECRAIMKVIYGTEKPVYVHCYAGVDRTGFIVALYGALRYGRCPHECWEEAQEAGMHKRYFWWRKSFLAVCAALKGEFGYAD